MHRAIEAGDTQTGITIMQMDAGLDTGDMLLVRTEAILPTDTIKPGVTADLRVWFW
ncbi:MAG: formyltransferase family protein [Novosphingobium sp.]